MSTSGNEDQNRRKSPLTEDPPSKRIEFLRARLLSERTVSRTARQRVDELAKRVSELEAQLKIVSLQRKKAEKATVTVLAILENHGISDVSEGFDSGSEQEDALYESNVSDNKDARKEILAEEHMETKDNDGDACSSSEIGSSASSVRSLSWKSNRNTLHSSNQKKPVDFARRRSTSFASTASLSSKNVVKSCRQRETRSAAEESRTDSSVSAACDNSVATHCQDLTGSTDLGTESLQYGFEHHDEKGQVGLPALQVSENQKHMDESNLFCTHEGDKDMETALQHQAQLIGQYEAEERAQREWEEKYGESTSFMPDSCENHSDVTEERDEMKASEQPCSPPGAINTHFSGAQKAPNGFQSPALANLTSSKTIVSDSGSEFAFPKGNYEPVHSEDTVHKPLKSCHNSLHVSCLPVNPIEHTSSSSSGSSLRKGEASVGYDLALKSHRTSKNVQPVLQALEQAKLSLKWKLNTLPQIESRSSIKAIEPSIHAGKIGERVEIPVGCPALFRLPLNLQCETTSKASYLCSPSQFSLANHSTETVAGKFYHSPSITSGSIASAGSQLPSISTSLSTHIGSRSAAWRHTLEPAFNTGLPSSSRFNFLDPHLSSVIPFSSNYTIPTYPFVPDLMPRLSSSEGSSTTFPTRESGMPPAARFSLYNDHITPNMHR